MTMRTPSKRPMPTSSLTTNLSVNPGLVYMTAAERDTFKMLRATNRLSFFRVQRCGLCDTDVPRPKLYCSKEHMMEHVENMQAGEDGTETSEPVADNIVRVVRALIGKRIALETKDGSRRNGELTDVTWDKVKVDGHDVIWPHGLILNGERADEVNWEWLAWVRKA
ncbi:hypothetical protein LCGC14_1197780 [marine sediment metagenome]|uniref:Uncharacterized protein n=1 Tax=marine sediment metagenome TaxID=412755 RepID=A0A0F9M549_9ZZZZ